MVLLRATAAQWGCVAVMCLLPAVFCESEGAAEPKESAKESKPINTSAPFPEEERLALKEDAREMFYHAYSAYMQNAYPADELLPLSCAGRYRDAANPRGDIDDVLGNFSLTLIDSLSSLVVLGDLNEFDSALQLIVRDVTFDRDVWVSVFETNIRMLGGLVSGHVLASHVQRAYGAVPWYGDQLLLLAADLATRLLPAFNTTTGIPYPRVNLRHGAASRPVPSTCTSCAGSLLLEFASLSRLTGLPVFEQKARVALDALWRHRNRASDLPGTVLDVSTGAWLRQESGVGAGVDSYYEYLLKGHILFGEAEYLTRFRAHYAAVQRYMAAGPLMMDVHMHRPAAHVRNFCDTFQAFWPGLQVLTGDLSPAVAHHHLLHHITSLHTFLPEAFTTDFKVHWGQHPLRPEFIESTYLLYEATRDPHYLTVGRQALRALQSNAWVPCGYAAIQDVKSGKKEDRMDSFVLSETFKYLYLLFSEPSELPIDMADFVFTTEGHPLPLDMQKYAVNSEEFAVRLEEFSAKAGNRFSEILKNGENPNIYAAEESLAEQAEGADKEENKAEKETEEGSAGSWLESPQDPSVCPRSSRQQWAADIRAGVDRDYIRQAPTRPRRLKAADFRPDSEAHQAILRELGIVFRETTDGRVSFLLREETAASPADRAEGNLFMQEVHELERVAPPGPGQQRHGVVWGRPLNATHASVAQSGAGGALFGPGVPPGREVEGAAVFASPPSACSPLDNPAAVRGRVAVVRRGDCMFVAKARVLQQHGAIGGVVLDNAPTPVETPSFAMLGDNTTDDVTIPLLFLFPGPAQRLSQDMKLAEETLDRRVTVLLTELTDDTPETAVRTVRLTQGGSLRRALRRAELAEDLGEEEERKSMIIDIIAKHKANGVAEVKALEDLLAESSDLKLLNFHEASKETLDKMMAMMRETVVKIIAKRGENEAGEEVSADEEGETRKEREGKKLVFERRVKEFERALEVIQLRAHEAGIKELENEIKLLESEIKLHEVEFKPQEAEMKPQEAEMKPQEAGMKPQEAEMKPQEAENKPQEAEMKPQEAEMKPQEAEMKPQQAETTQHEVEVEETANSKNEESSVGSEASSRDEL